MGTATHEALQQQLDEGVSHEFTRAAPAHLAQERGREGILFPEQLELMLAHCAIGRIADVAEIPCERLLGRAASLPTERDGQALSHWGRLAGIALEQLFALCRQRG